MPQGEWEKKERICQNCGTKFLSKSSIVLSCSEECKKIIKKQNTKEKNLYCRICNEEFSTKNSRSLTCGKRSCIAELKKKSTDPEKRKMANERLSQKMKGRKRSPEILEKMKKIFSGVGNPRYGKIVTEETRKKISDKLKENARTKEKVYHDLVCTNCKFEYKSKRKDSKFCSTKCGQLFRNPPLNQKQEAKCIERICPTCNKTEIVRKKGASKYCSAECRSKTYLKNKQVKKKCKLCQKDFSCKQQRQRDFCSRSCSTTYQNKQNDWSIVGKKISETKKEQFRKGIRVHSWLGRKHSKETKDKLSKFVRESKRFVGENNPMFGKTHTAAAREKISKAQTNNRIKPWLRNKTGYFYSQKNNETYIFRSSWEEIVFNRLEKDEKVISFIAEPFYIKYEFDGYVRRYTPDILVEYLNGTRKLFEIKPENFVGYKINVAKFEAARQYCKKNNIEFEILTEKQILT